MDDSEYIESLEKIRGDFLEIISLYKNFSENHYPYRSINDLPILTKVTELIQSSQEIVDEIRIQRLSSDSEDTQKKSPEL